MLIRKIKSNEADILKNWLYEAIYVPDDSPNPPISILEEPLLRAAYENWGRAGDIGLVLELDSRIVGACWVRLYEEAYSTYGIVGPEIPVLSIAVHKDHRGLGYGSKLLFALIEELKGLKYPGVSLSVDRMNGAYTWYKKIGFKAVSNEGNPTMLLKF